MSSDTEITGRRIPTLVQICQRVASAHVDSICGFGGSVRYELIKPILEHCSIETLIRLEEASPHIRTHTSDLWKEMCFRHHSLAAEQHCSEEPESWREHFFFLRDVETKRLDELRNRIRTKRLKAECEKKEREIKLTDNILPIKRSRNKWSANPQSKTLFQKTRSEASKFQKSIFSLQMVPRMPDGKSYRVLHNSLSAKLPPALPSTSPSCVTVTRTQCPKPSLPSVSATLPSDSQPTSPTDDAITDQPQTNLLPNGRPPNTGKKDPMASLFIPKHRAHSQLPSTPSRSSRTTAPLTSRTRILS